MYQPQQTLKFASTTSEFDTHIMGTFWKCRSRVSAVLIKDIEYANDMATTLVIIKLRPEYDGVRMELEERN